MPARKKDETLRVFIAALSLFSLFLLTGCWDKFELTEWGFVQGVAIDQTKEGKIELTTQFYKPMGGGGPSGGAQGGPSFINITTKDDTVFEAVRDITIHLGRKPQWSHLAVIIIQEDLAKKKRLGEILDFFYRNHEPRLNIRVMIAKGKASDYLQVKPLIENTLAQQIHEVQKYASRFSAKVVDSDLLKLAIQMKSEVDTGMIPYLYFGETKPKEILQVGISLIKKGKMVGLVSPKNVEPLLMLADEYQGGIIEIPCGKRSKGQNKPMETMEVLKFNGKVAPKVKGNSITVEVKIKIRGSIGELYCSSLETRKDEKIFEEKIKKTVEKDLQRMIKLLQEKKVDVIGIGNKIYSQNPALWKSWKKDWDEHFARSQFTIKVEAIVDNTKMEIGKPFYSK